MKMIYAITIDSWKGGFSYKNKINRIRIIGNGTLLTHQILNKQYWSEVPGMLYIPVPEDQLDSNMTVIAILLDKPLSLHSEEIKPIESN